MDNALDNQARTADDAELIARLVAGEHLGERHDAELARIAASPVLATALRVALATQAEAETLARAIARERAPRVVPFAARPRHRAASWVALAATVAGVALLATSMQGTHSPSSQPAVAQQPDGDSIFGQTFEGAIVDNGGEANGDEIFDGEFDT